MDPPEGPWVKDDMNVARILLRVALAIRKDGVLSIISSYSSSYYCISISFLQLLSAFVVECFISTTIEFLATVSFR